MILSSTLTICTYNFTAKAMQILPILCIVLDCVEHNYTYTPSCMKYLLCIHVAYMHSGIHFQVQM